MLSLEFPGARQLIAAVDAAVILPDEAATTDALRHALGFDRPLLVQYGSFLADVLRLDFGRSLVQNIPVVDILAVRVPYTLALTAGALIVACGIGIPTGIALALSRGRIATRVLSGIAIQCIKAGPGLQQVVARAAKQAVIAAVAIQRVIAAEARDRVCAGRAVQRVVAAVACQYCHGSSSRLG